MRLCDEDCNNCQIILSKNYRQLTKILNIAHEKFGNEFYKIVENNCPNMTVCQECRIDDFVHVEDCKILENIDKEAS